MDETAICIVDFGNHCTQDLEVPLNLPACSLILALRHMYKPEQGPGGLKDSCLRCENPVALLHGSRTLKDYGIRNGTIFHLHGSITESGTIKAPMGL